MHDTSLLCLMCSSAVLRSSCPRILLFLICESVLLCVSASLCFLLHGSEHAAVLSVPPAAVWQASYCFSVLNPAAPRVQPSTLYLYALFSVHSLLIAR